MASGTTRSDNTSDVVLVTQDAKLRAAVQRRKPSASNVQILSAGEFMGATAPTAGQLWIDLDCIETVRADASAPRWVYFYSRPGLSREHLPNGLFVRKPCPPTVLDVLWAGVVPAGSAPRKTAETGTHPDRFLPGWLLELHELDLRALCHRTVATLTEHLGYRETALYLLDPSRCTLVLAETNASEPRELSVRLDHGVDHIFRDAIQSAGIVRCERLADACSARRVQPPQPEWLADQPALIAPLHHAGQPVGLVMLSGCGPERTADIGIPVATVFRFLACAIYHARQYDQARTEARIDGMTGLFNYRWMVESLEKEIHRCERYGNPLSLLMIDLDGLKPVNDRHGHRAGDAVLRHVAGRISSVLRQIDSAARVGGDEFVVMLPATDLEGARHAAERVLEAVRDDEAHVCGMRVPVSVSLGVAGWQSGWDAARLLDAADQAMYRAKKQGGNRMTCWSAEEAALPPLAEGAPVPTVP